MEQENPRYPHWCRVIRKTTQDPMEEEDDFSPLDQEVNIMDEGDAEIDSTKCTVIYEGKCRSYEKNTTSDKGEVITSYRGLSLPLNQDAWVALGLAPQEGDEIVVLHGNFKEYGRIIDKNVATASFAGTHIIWKYGRN